MKKGQKGLNFCHFFVDISQKTRELKTVGNLAILRRALKKYISVIEGTAPAIVSQRFDSPNPTYVQNLILDHMDTKKVKVIFIISNFHWLVSQFYIFR